MASTMLKLKKNPAMGTKNTDEPKPPMVPSISHKKAASKKSISKRKLLYLVE